jgi:ribosomal protein S18 acetylase RimI-like enzyme
MLLAVAPPEEGSALDVAVRLDPAVPGPDAVATAQAFYGRNGRGFMLYTRGEADADLAHAATAAGLVQLVRQPQMVCAQAPEPAVSAVAIERVGSTDGVVAFRDTLVDAYADAGLSRAEAAWRFRDPAAWLTQDLHLFTARDADRTLAVAVTFVAAGTAGVYLVGTAPAARGRGIGTAIAAAATRAGFDAGASQVSLQSTALAEALYRRLGYHGVYLYRGFYGSAAG